MKISVYINYQATYLLNVNKDETVFSVETRQFIIDDKENNKIVILLEEKEPQCFLKANKISKKMYKKKVFNI
ncbi:hypothetical protein CQA69_08615 [Campylobacter estrildidarum]|uniref:Uncharacterized protein n=1 Tax=Campylobacter estrildidarum TaxID=2510189 RepID=A0A4U7BB55_9BACT|nr:hypothetical protein CQA69_08615 [Campylobacter estrildidarum]